MKNSVSASGAVYINWSSYLPACVGKKIGGMTEVGYGDIKRNLCTPSEAHALHFFKISLV